MLYWVILFIAAFVVVKVSTLGWKFSGKKFVVPPRGNEELARDLKSYVYKLSHDIGDRSVFKYDKLKEAEYFVAQTLGSFGYQVRFQNYMVKGRTVTNIIATRQGQVRPGEVIIVGAHYDTCFNPGADDNASAVAGLLELARFFADKNPARTVKFIAFVNEEPPFYHTPEMGSRFYTINARSSGEDIKAALILEMIGYYDNEYFSQRYPPFIGPFYPNRGNFITVVGNLSYRWLVKRVASSFRKHTSFPVESISLGFLPGVDFSDHWSFWQEKYPAVMITDTAFYRNPYYHSGEDTPEKLNYEYMAEVVKGLSGVVEELAQ